MKKRVTSYLNVFVIILNFFKELAISLSTVLKLIVRLLIGSPPTILLVKPPNIDFKIEGTPGNDIHFQC